MSYYATDGRNAVQQLGLAEEHLALAGWVVSVMMARMPPLGSGIREDLESCARVALVEVAGRYDAACGASFATYAVPRLRGAVLDELRRVDWASRGVRDGGNRLAEAEEKLSVELGRTPTSAELAERLALTGRQLDQLRFDLHRALSVKLDGLLIESDDTPIELASSTPSPEALLIRREEASHLRACIDVLPTQIREVITRHFLGEETLTAIAADMGITLSRASQVRARGLVLLRAALTRVWGVTAAEPAGGIRARNEESRYVDLAVHACLPVAVAS